MIFVGTNQGRFITLKLLPQSHGGYTVQTAGVTNLDGSIISIAPIDANTGRPAQANPSNVANLRTGLKINGVVVVVTQTGVKVFKPTTAKGATKTWSDFLCDSAAVATYDNRGCALIALFGDGHARTFSIPGLKEIASIKVDHILDIKRLPEALISPTGDIFGWTGPSEVAILNVWGSGQDT